MQLILPADIVALLAPFAPLDLPPEIDLLPGVTCSPWSQGPVEGHVNRLKLLKRQMYGRVTCTLERCPADMRDSREKRADREDADAQEPVQ